MLSRQSPEKRLARAVQLTLLTGLLTSVLLLIGGLLRAARPGVNEGEVPPALRELVAGAIRGDGTSLSDLGLLVLMLTPVARVIVLGTGWALAREWRFAVVATVVLALLATSLVLGTG